MITALAIQKPISFLQVVIELGVYKGLIYEGNAEV